MVTGPRSAGARPVLPQLRKAESASSSTLSWDDLQLAQRLKRDAPDGEPPLRSHAGPQDDDAPLAVFTTAPTPRATPAAAPALPAPEPLPPSATLLALARSPASLPRQWQLEITTQPHAQPLVLRAEHQAADGWALQVHVAPATAVQQERLATRLSRSGIAVSSLQVHPHHEGLDDDVADDRR